MTSSKFKVQIELNHILSLVQSNLSQKEMQEKLNLKKSTLSMRLKKAQELGYLTPIGRSNPQFWEITPLGKEYLEKKFKPSSVGVSRKDFRLHYFSIKMPIIADNSQDFWDKSWNLNNWKRQFKDLQDIGVSIERTTTHVLVNLKPMTINKDVVENMAHDAALYMMGFLKERGIEVDYQARKVSRQSYAVATPIVQPFIEQGMTMKVSLGRPQAKIFDNDNPKEAVAEFDDSMRNGGEIEGNDLPYAQNIKNAEAVLLMPEAVRKVISVTDRIERIEKEIQGSFQTLNALSNTQMLMASGWKITQEKMIKIEKHIKTLGQKRIKEFL